MIKIKLYDGAFAHHGPTGSASSFPGHIVIPKHFQWERDPNAKCDISVFTEGSLHEVYGCDSSIKIAFLMEPRLFGDPCYENIESLELSSVFDIILTHDQKLLAKGGKFVKYVPCGSWIKESDWKIYPKTKNICAIASFKQQLPGHKLRHQAIRLFAQKYNIDVYGNAYNRFENTIDVLRDYRYCVVIENVKDGFMMTEKLFGPMLAGCIPIYYGTDEARKIFSDRLITFNDLDELGKKLPNCTDEMYNMLMHSTQLNFEKAKEFAVVEDWLWENVFKRLVV